MVKHWKDGLHEVLLVGQCLHLGPLVLNDGLISFFIVIDDAGFDALDLFVATTLRLLDLLDEVVSFKDGSVRLSLHDVATDELLVRQQLAGESITNIDDAVVLARKVRPVINLRISIIVEEDVLGVVVSLINQQELGNLAMVVVLLPVLVVLLDGHAGPLLKSLQAVLELRDDVVDEACVLELFHVV